MNMVSVTSKYSISCIVINEYGISCIVISKYSTIYIT